VIQEKVEKGFYSLYKPCKPLGWEQASRHAGGQTCHTGKAQGDRETIISDAKIDPIVILEGRLKLSFRIDISSNCRLSLPYISLMGTNLPIKDQSSFIFKYILPTQQGLHAFNY